ncbi:MAG: S9 family peptidase [Chloroflexi bacterium]|nr:S9 family peptidase [Chloroflexota bacterium]
MNNELKIPSIDDMIELPVPGNAVISPDGEIVAYTVTQANWKQNEFVKQIWVVPVSGGEPRQLTFARSSSFSPRWSPDGQWLAFLSRRNDDAHTQIYRISPKGGEAERLSEHETDIESFKWSPDGRSIAFTAADQKSEAQKHRQEAYGDYQVEDEHLIRSNLWLLRLENRQELKLTAGQDFHMVDFDWNPTHGWIAFEAWPSPDECDYDHSRIFLLDIDSLGITLLADEGSSSPRWSPDGRRLAFSRFGEPSYFANNSLHVLSFEGMAAEHEVITALLKEDTIRVGNVLEPAAFFAPAPPQHKVPMDFDEDMQLLDWGLDGLYCTALQRTEIHLFRVDPDTGRVRLLTPAGGTGWVSASASFDREYSQAAVVAYDARHYGEVSVVNLASGQVKTLTHFNDAIKNWQLGQAEVIQWKSSDGVEIEGILTKPADFDPQRKYPLLVVVHGGSSWASFQALLYSSYDRRMYPIQQWVAKGALVLQPNYRGSAGYGEAFRSLNVRNLGLGDCADIVSGIDALIERGWVDPERVGIMGWSQGGYISAFCATYSSERFRAASVGAGISNWLTYYANTDIHPFTRQYLGSNPCEDIEIYRVTSPITYLQRAQTPTLIQHGEADKRVPLPNAYELYQGLRDIGVEVRLVTFPGMSHGPTKPRTCRQIMMENDRWFRRWIWDEMIESPEGFSCYVAIAGIKPPTPEGDIPAYVRDVMRSARRDGVDFHLFSPQAGLVRTFDLSFLDAADLSPEELVERVNQIAKQLRAEKIRRMVVFTIKNHQDSATLLGLSCLHLAAALAGSVSLEQRQISL